VFGTKLLPSVLKFGAMSRGGVAGSYSMPPMALQPAADVRTGVPAGTVVVAVAV